MSYATKDGKREWARRYRAQKRLAACCLQCHQPAAMGGLCRSHAEAHRTRSRLWMQTHHGHEAREAFTFPCEQRQTFWEEIGGWWYRVSADFRDPLTILLEREARGQFIWRTN